MDEPHAQRRDEERIRPVPVIGGVIVGFMLTWLVFAVVLFSLYAAYGDSTGTAQDVIAVLGLVGLPVLLGLLLIPRRTRHWGAGLLLGVAIGSISAAGVCGGAIGLNAI